jgi:hypothetical protein
MSLSFTCTLTALHTGEHPMVLKVQLSMKLVNGTHEAALSSVESLAEWAGCNHQAAYRCLQSKCYLAAAGADVR